jgi:hypothetical protein
VAELLYAHPEEIIYQLWHREQQRIKALPDSRGKVILERVLSVLTNGNRKSRVPNTTFVGMRKVLIFIKTY